MNANGQPKKVQEVGAAKLSPLRGHAGGKVIVMSKLPFALQLQLQTRREVERRYRDQRWVDVENVFEGPIVLVAGNAYPVGNPPSGTEWPERPPIAAGFALTFGVDADFWDKWVEQNQGLPAVKAGLIFAYEDLNDAKAHARDHRDAQSGFQPLVPDNDARLPKKAPATIARPRIDRDAVLDYAE